MKKFISIMMAMIIMVLCFSGCSSNASFVMSNEKTRNDNWKISYDKFNGYKEHEVTISGTGEHTFTIDIVTNSGTLGLIIKDSEGTSIYNGNELPSSSFAVKVDGEGKYIIRVDADSHSGSFDIKWQ